MPKCKKKSPEIESSSSDNSSIVSIIRAEIKKMVYDRENILMDKLDQINSGYTDIVLDLRSEVQQMANRIEKIEEENKQLREKVDLLFAEQENILKQNNEIQQEKLNCIMEISGMSTTHENSIESPEIVAEKVLNSCSIPVDSSKIVRAYKRVVNINNKPTKILSVVFSNYREKLRIMKMKRENIKEGNLFFNHALSHTNRTLYVQAKKFCQNSKFYVFISNGKIYIKKEGESEGLKIGSTEDLKQFIRMKIQQNSSQR